MGRGWLAALVLVLWPLLGSSAAAGVSAELLERAVAEGRVRVIVELDVAARAEGHLKGAAAVAQQRARIASARAVVESRLAASDHRVTRRYRTIPFIAVEASAAALMRLEREGLVRSVQEDAVEWPTLSQSTSLVEAVAGRAIGLDGSGFNVAVLDTGADAGHPMLSGKIVAEACFSGGRDCPNGRETEFGPGAGAPCTFVPEDCDHGTHVSGIAVGDGPSLAGVAPGAGLISIQVFSKFNGPARCGSGNSPCAASYVSDQIAALEYVLLLEGQQSPDLDPIAAVNMSLGGVPQSAQCDAGEPARKAAIDNLRSVGIATIASSGNEGDADGIGAPACISSAVSVGSTTNSDSISYFSNSDTYLSLLAPGSSIESAIPGGGTVSYSGTSMATPHVAGAWSLLRQHLPEASVEVALESLQGSGLPITDSRNGVTVSRIRVVAAANLLQCLDEDLDGVCDTEDVCPGFDDHLDTDSDGEPDGCDADDDGDGLLDVVETATGDFSSPSDTGTEPLAADTDGDGFNDGDEVLAGSDPTDAESIPTTVPVPALGPYGRLLLVLGLSLLALRRRA